MTQSRSTAVLFALAGQRLREQRERLGLSQSEFAARGGVKKLAQIRYEKGERRPSASYLLGIARAGADVAYIVTGQRASPRDALKNVEIATKAIAMLGVQDGETCRAQRALPTLRPDLQGRRRDGRGSMTLGARLRQERKRLRLTQAELARWGETCRKTQVRYETDTRSPAAPYLVSIAAAGIDVTYVLLGIPGAVAHPGSVLTGTLEESSFPVAALTGRQDGPDESL